MNRQFHKRPESSSRKARPITGQIPIQNQKQAEQCFEMGKRHMIKREYNEALKHYNNALIHNPKDTKSLCNMGSVFKQLGQLQQSYDCYMQALNINGDDYIAIYNLANLERIRSNYENANALYLRVLKLKQKGVKLGTLDYDSFINRSICLEKLDDFDGAIESCNAAIKLNPSDESAYFNKAMNLMKKIYQSARSSYTNVTNQLCKQTKQQLEKILKMKPNLSRCKVALVELKFLCDVSKQNLEAAKRNFEELMKNDSNIGTHEVEIKLKLFDSILNISNKLAHSKRIQPPPARPIISNKNKEPRPARPAKPANTTPLGKPIKVEEPEVRKENSDGTRKLSQEIVTKQQEEKQIKLEPNEAQKQQGEKVKIIRKLLSQKKYSEAFIQARKLNDKLQKYELQIQINLEEIQHSTQASNSQKLSLLQTALQIYNTKIKNDLNTEISRKTCTERGHEIMATLLNIAEWYTQASKHYEVLLQIADDKNEEQLSSQKKKDIHAGLGACYSQTGRVKEAIQEYENSLKIEPKNYFLMTNLCGLLIRDNREKEAKEIYKNFLDQNGGKGMANKTHYIDSLVNISICEKETPSEEEAVQLAIKELQQYYPTYQDIKRNLDEEAILNLYLRWIDILETKAGQANLSQEETQRLNEQLLDSYLSCLQFQNCPDRQAISINSGIIFYLNKFYTNALAFFRTITYPPNKKLLANNIGLTMAHLHEHEKAYSSFSLAVEENPDNIIYNTNFEIMKWIYGVSEINLEKYNCKCEAMFGNRVNFGIYMFDRLTNMIVKNQVKSENEPGSNQTIQSIVINLINQLMSSIKQAKQSSFQTVKFDLLTKIFNEHSKECNQDKTNQFVNESVVTKYLKICGSEAQIEAGLKDIFGFVSSLPKSSPKVTLCKGLVYVFLAANSKKLGEQKVSGCWQNFKKSKSGLSLSSNIQSLAVEHPDIKQALSNIQHNRKVNTKITHPSLSFRVVENIVRDAECVFENSLQFVISKIEQVYYSKPNSLISPFELSYNHPHCSNVVTCNECLIRYVDIYSSVFAKKLKCPLLTNEQENINQFFRQIQIFSKQCYEEGNPIFSKEEKQVEVNFSTKILPFKLITHHRSIDGAREFLKLLNTSFTLASDSKKGVQTLQLGKSLILQLWWGDVSFEDKMWHELQTKQNMVTHSHILANSFIDNLIEISDESETGKEGHLGSMIAKLFDGK